MTETEQRQMVTRRMVEQLMLSMALEREGVGVELTPCGVCQTLLDGVTVDELEEGVVHYMLYYNVGADTHAVSVRTIVRAEGGTE